MSIDAMWANALYHAQTEGSHSAMIRANRRMTREQRKAARRQHKRLLAVLLVLTAAVALTVWAR